MSSARVPLRELFAARSSRDTGRAVTKLAAIACLPLGLSACASRGAAPQPAQREAPSARIVALTDLPAPEREVLDAWRRGGATWEAARERTLADPKLAAFLVDNVVRDLVRNYDRSKLAQEGEPDGPFERAREELVRCGTVSAPVLAQLLDVKDGVVAFLAADVLASIGAVAIDPTAAQLASPREETRRRAAELLARLPHAAEREIPIQQELARLVASDAAWIARAEAAKALGARGSRHEHKGFAMGVLVKALRDGDETVARTAGEALGVLGEPRGIPALARELQVAADAGRPGVVGALEGALARLSGDGRTRSPAQWSDWWRKHEARFTPPPRSTKPGARP